MKPYPQSEFLLEYDYKHSAYHLFYKRGKHVKIYQDKAGPLLRLINNHIRTRLEVYNLREYSLTIVVTIEHGSKMIDLYPPRKIEAIS